MAGRGEAFGMMDAAFFVGKNELLTWLNEILQLNYTKVRPWPSPARIPAPSPPTALPSASTLCHSRGHCAARTVSLTRA